MNPTSEILERVNKSSSEHHDGVFTRLFRYLLREDIYFAAYQKLCTNRSLCAENISRNRTEKCAHWVFRHFEINFCKRRLECFWKQSMNRYFMTSHMVSDRREVVIQLSTR